MINRLANNYCGASNTRCIAWFHHSGQTLFRTSIVDVFTTFLCWFWLCGNFLIVGWLSRGVKLAPHPARRMRTKVDKRKLNTDSESLFLSAHFPQRRIWNKRNAYLHAPKHQNSCKYRPRSIPLSLAPRLKTATLVPKLQLAHIVAIIVIVERPHSILGIQQSTAFKTVLDCTNCLRIPWLETWLPLLFHTKKKKHSPGRYMGARRWQWQYSGRNRPGRWMRRLCAVDGPCYCFRLKQYWSWLLRRL